MKTALNRIVVVTMAFLLVSASPAAAAQRQDVDPTIHTSELTGVVIEATGETFEISDSELQHYPNGEGEVVHLSAPVMGSSLEISFFDDGDTPEQTLDIYIGVLEAVSESAEVLDRGTAGDYAYALVLVVFEGVEIIYYAQVYQDYQGSVDLYESILTSSFMFETDVLTAQEEVTIDGVPFMDNVNAAELNSIVTGGGTLAEDVSATPVTPVDTAEFSMVDVSVGIGPEFHFPGSPEADGTYESVRIQGPDTLSLVAVGDTSLSPEMVLSSFSTGIVNVHESTEIVHEEIGDDSAWRLLWIPKEGGPATFMLIVAEPDVVPDMDFMHAHEVPASSVAGSIITIQDQITVNGEPLLAEIDPEEIGALADAYRSDDGGSATPQPTEVAPEEPAVERSGDPRDDARLPESGNDAEPGNTSETTGTLATPASDGVQSGVLTDSSWEGGVHGQLIAWDPAVWFVDTAYPGDLISDAETQQDLIVLQSESSEDITWFFVSVYGEADSTPVGYLEYWLSPEFAEGFEVTPDILTSRTRGGDSGVVFSYTNSAGNEFIMIRQAVTLDNGNVVVITLDAPAEEALEMYELALDVTIEGEPVLRVFSVNQLERVIGD